MKGWFLRLQATGKFVLNPRHRFLQTFPRAQDPPLSASQNPFLPEIFRILEMLFCRISPGRPAEISVDKVNSYCNSWHIAGDRRTMSAQYGALSPDCAALPRVEPRAQPTKGRKMPHLGDDPTSAAVPHLMPHLMPHLAGHAPPGGRWLSPRVWCDPAWRNFFWTCWMGSESEWAVAGA